MGTSHPNFRGGKWRSGWWSDWLEATQLEPGRLRTHFGWILWSGIFSVQPSQRVLGRDNKTRRQRITTSRLAISIRIVVMSYHVFSLGFSISLGTVLSFRESQETLRHPIRRTAIADPRIDWLLIHYSLIPELFHLWIRGLSAITTGFFSERDLLVWLITSPRTEQNLGANPTDVALDQLFLGLGWESSVDTLGAKWEKQTLAKGGTVPSRSVKCQSSCCTGVPRSNIVLWEISRGILGVTEDQVWAVVCITKEDAVCSLSSQPESLSFCLFSSLKHFFKFMYFWAGLSLVAASGGYALVAMCGLLVAVASLVAEHRL